MLERIKRLLAGVPPSVPDREAAPGPAAATQGASAGAPGGAGEEPLRLAACALLLELAHADDHFSPQERQHIEQAMSRHFDVSPEAVHELMEQADHRRRDSVELHQFTSRVTQAYDEGQRLLLAEIMWRVVEADGHVTSHEDYLMRKLGRLLDLRPGYLAEARKRATTGLDP